MGNEISKPTKTSYTWTVAFGNYFADMICSGFAHMHGIEDYPGEIMELLVKYVKESIDLEYFQNSPAGYVITNPRILSINKNHKFFMEIWPNYEDSNTQVPPLYFKLYYISSPSNIKQIRFKCKLKLPFIEQDLILHEYLRYDHCSSKLWD